MPFLPLHDDARRQVIERPWVSWGLIAMTFAVFLLHPSGSDMALARFVHSFGVIPAVLGGEARLTGALDVIPAWLTLITYQFLHGGWAHLGGNLLYLWVFGDNIEDATGHWRFLIFYLVCGAAAAFIHYAAAPHSTVPLVGASGAIAGVLGAYLMLHPKAKILVPIIIIPLYLPAWLLILVWLGIQVMAVSGGDASQGGTAWWAHIGGFLTGIILIGVFRRPSVALLGRGDLPDGTTQRDHARVEARRKHHDDKEEPWR
jgi:membrane associated rhomboid family serine protease